MAGTKRVSIAMGGLFALAAMVFIAAAIVEPAGSDDVAPGEHMRFVQENEALVRASHWLWAAAGALLFAAAVVWFSARSGPSRTSAKAANGLIGAGGFLLLIASLLIAGPMTDAALNHEAARFDALERAASTLFPWGMVAFLLGFTVLWALTRSYDDRPMPNWALLVGAISTGSSAIGILGAAILHIELLGWLALPTMIVPIIMAWYGISIAIRPAGRAVVDAHEHESPASPQ